MATSWDNESEDWNAAEEARDSTWSSRRSSWTGAREERGRSWSRVANPVGYSVDMTEDHRGRPHPNAFNVYGHSGQRWRSHSESGTSWSGSSWNDVGRGSSDSGRSWEHVSQDSEFREPEPEAVCEFESEVVPICGSKPESESVCELEREPEPKI